MKDFFARLYEWFGLIPLYSKDLSEYLKGLDFACTGYLAFPWYAFVGLLMIAITVLIFIMQYDIIDTKRFKRQRHWAQAAVRIVGFNFFLAFGAPFVALLQKSYCYQLKFTVFDCIGFGISNAIWSLVLFSILSLIQLLVQRK